MAVKGKGDNVIVERIPLIENGQVLAVVTLNRPEELNPLDRDTGRKMHRILEKLCTDKAVRVIAITGAGKAFSAGGDLKAYLKLQHDEEGFRQFLTSAHILMDYIEALEKPVIALVNGYCVAGGLELLLACDFAYAAESAKIGDGHVNYGQMGEVAL